MLWGCLVLHFWSSGRPMGGFGGPRRPPWPPRAPKVKFSQFLSLPFGGHFWSILEVKNGQKLDAFFDGLVRGVFVVLGWILGPVLRIFWSFLGTFCDMAKTRKIARRVGESTKIEGWGDHKWRPNQKKSHRKQIPKLKREIIPKWTKNGGQMEPKWSQKGIQKSMIFWLGFRTPLETSTELRGDCGCSRKCHTFSSRPPRAAPYYQRILYKNKQRQDSLADLARLGPLARRIFVNFGLGKP